MPPKKLQEILLRVKTTIRVNQKIRFILLVVKVSKVYGVVP